MTEKQCKPCKVADVYRLATYYLLVRHGSGLEGIGEPLCYQHHRELCEALERWRGLTILESMKAKKTHDDDRPEEGGCAASRD